MKAVIVGSTGGIGRWVVHTLAKDKRVEKVTAMVRQGSKSAPYFYLSEKEANYWNKVHQVVVNYDNIDSTLFRDHDLGFSGLGLYTSDAKSEEHFRQVEIVYNVNAAKAMLAGGVTKYAYLSGAGASQTGSFIMFARVKGEAEKAVQELGFERATVVRPGAILGRGDDAHVPSMYFNMDRFEKFIPARWCVQAQDIAKAMVYSTMAPLKSNRPNDNKWILENLEIREKARLYDQEKLM